MTVKRQKLQQKRTQRGAPVQDLPLPRKPLRAWARDELLPPRTITGLLEPWSALTDWVMLRHQYSLPRTRGDSQVGTATFHKYDRGRTMAWNLRHIRRPGVITAGTTLGFPVHRLARQFAPSLACPFRATRQSQVHRRPRRPQHTRPAHNTR